MVDFLLSKTARGLKGQLLAARDNYLKIKACRREELGKETTPIVAGSKAPITYPACLGLRHKGSKRFYCAPAAIFFMLSEEQSEPAVDNIQSSLISD